MSEESAAIAGQAAILVVDDDPLIAMTTVDMLEDLGHRACEASSGEAALDMLAADPSIALVITDHAMPGMTGVELARRARERRPGLPVLLATGYGASMADDPALPRLTKPFLQRDLSRAVSMLLNGAA